jgi:multisubunit Na+/H+ antiporter MnhE subunit
MPLFYQRKETSDEIIISYKNWIVYLLLGIVILSLILYSAGSNLYISLSWAFLILFTIVFFDTFRPNLEVSRSKKKKGVEIKGNYFSFSGSITVTIKKEY